MNDVRWIALHCGEETSALLAKYPNAFLLLTQISMRARWKDCAITKLKAGQALIGDWQQAGLQSEKAYRHAKDVLADCKLVKFKGASKGTVATLLDSTVFSITTNPKGGQTGEQRADEGLASGGQGATNHKDTQSTQNTTIPCLVTDSASAGGVQSPHPANAFSIGQLMTVEEAKRCSMKIRAIEVSSEPDGNFAIFPPEEFSVLAVDWHIKAEQTGWLINERPMRDPEKALHGYLRKAINRKSKKFKELRCENPDDGEPPF